jgi:MoxR-like ATPase
VSVGDSNRLLAADRATVERTARDLVLGVVERRAPTGVSVVVEGAPGIGKTFLVREILAAVAPGAAKVLRVAGQPGRGRGRGRARFAEA